MIVHCFGVCDDSIRLQCHVRLLQDRDSVLLLLE